MPRTRVQPGSPLRIGSRDWNDVLNLLDNQRGKDAKGGLGRKLIVIPRGTWAPGTARICVVRKFYGNFRDGQPITAINIQEEKLLVGHPGPTAIENGDAPEPVYPYYDTPDGSTMYGAAELFDGGYWLLTSVFC